MKKCGSCFRYCENWRDAEAKGVKPVRYNGFAEYFYKPRKGVAPHALGIHCPEDNEIHSDHPACEDHECRWLQNIKVWWRWHFRQAVTGLFCKYIRVPIGNLRKPIPLGWKDSFDGIADRIIPNGESECPRCGEMPYSYEQCNFCGQRFLPDESCTDKTAPQRELREGEPIIFVDGICPECGYSCGNGGCGPLRCRCGWVGEEREISDCLKKAIEEALSDENSPVDEAVRICTDCEAEDKI